MEGNAGRFTNIQQGDQTRGIRSREIFGNFILSHSPIKFTDQPLLLNRWRVHIIRNHYLKESGCNTIRVKVKRFFKIWQNVKPILLVKIYLHQNRIQSIFTSKISHFSSFWNECACLRDLENSLMWNGLFFQLLQVCGRNILQGTARVYCGSMEIQMRVGFIALSAELRCVERFSALAVSRTTGFIQLKTLQWKCSNKISYQ